LQQGVLGEEQKAVATSHNEALPCGLVGHQVYLLPDFFIYIAVVLRVH